MTGLNYLEFRVVANGKPVKTLQDTRAFASTDDSSPKDVTNYLRLVGAPLDVAAYLTSTCPLSSKARKQLASAGLLDEEGNPCSPIWETRTQFYWTQHFSADSEVRLHQSYRPVVGGNYGGFAGDGSHVDDKRCEDRVDPAQYQRWKALKPVSAEGGVDFYRQELNYILTTARNWKGPIGTFRLTIDLPHEDDLLAICEPGLKKVSPTRFTLTRKNFTPDRELELTVYTTHDPSESKPRNSHLQ